MGQTDGRTDGHHSTLYYKIENNYLLYFDLNDIKIELNNLKFSHMRLNYFALKLLLNQICKFIN